MQLTGKNAIVYGATGAMGGAVSRAYAREGARVFLVARTESRLKALADEIRAEGGLAEYASVDAMDQDAVNAHAAEVVAEAGGIDVAFNAVDVRAKQNVPITEISFEHFMMPIKDAFTTNFVTGTACGRHMVERGSGVIIMLPSTASKETRHQMGGFGVACAGVEALIRTFAGEFGGSGVRVVGIRPNFTPETIPGAKEEDCVDLLRDTLLKRLPRLSQIGATAVYLASEGAASMTGVVVNLSAGAIID